MLKRKAMNRLESWRDSRHYRALLVSGARQVGKTYLIREFAKTHYNNYIEINLLYDNEARDAFNAAQSANALFSAITAYGDGELVANETLIFIDEVQESKEVVTFIKSLVERNDFDYILSGSLLGVELKNIRSVPVGYLDMLTMYPLDFEEYCWSYGIKDDLKSQALDAFKNKTEVPEYLHKRLMQLFHEYLIVGGMPAAVDSFRGNQNIQWLRDIQSNIIAQYKQDAAKYNAANQVFINRIYDMIPKELSSQNKRFKVKDIDGKTRLSRYSNDFLWLCEAGVAIAVYNAKEPRYPLMLNMDSSYFKLFMSDVGLLTCVVGMNATREMLADRRDVNYGALYENAVAQELAAHKFDMYYFKNKNMGDAVCCKGSW
jgi:predicted AAA+ superfamily ATPase